MRPRIETEQLWVDYRTRGSMGWRRRTARQWGLRDVSLRVGAGEILGIIGGNGSGKTTLLQALRGVIRPTRGRITTLGRVASLLSLEAGPDRDLTGRENLLVAAVLLGLTRSETRARQDEVIRFAGLSEDRMDEPISAFSAGMRLRLQLSLLLHTDASVLLIDEVLAVGDADFQHRCLDRMVGQVAAGVSAVIASHDMELIQARCDRAAVLDRGVLRFLGPSHEAVQHHLELRRAEADGRDSPVGVWA